MPTAHRDPAPGRSRPGRRGARSKLSALDPPNVIARPPGRASHSSATPPSPPTPSSGSAVAGRFRALSGSSTTQPPPWSAVATSTGRSTATGAHSAAAWAFTTTGRSPTSRRAQATARTSASRFTPAPRTRPSRGPSRRSPAAVALACGCSIPGWYPSRCALSALLARMAEAVEHHRRRRAPPSARTLDEQFFSAGRSWPALSRAVQPCRRDHAYDARGCCALHCRAGEPGAGDLDLVLVRFSPDFHYDPPPEWLIAGMPTSTGATRAFANGRPTCARPGIFSTTRPSTLVDAGDVFASSADPAARPEQRHRTQSGLGQVFWNKRGPTCARPSSPLG